MKNALSLLRIGCDLDGVLNDLGETTLLELKKRGLCPQEFSADQVTHYEFEKNIPGLTAAQVWDVFKEGEVFQKARLISRGAAVLGWLTNQGAQVHIVTSRNFSQRHRTMTEEWLRNNDVRYDRLAIYGKGEKADYARCHKLDVFIEDHLPTALEMCDVVRTSLILDQPYNRFVYPPCSDYTEPEPVNLLRMFSWESIGRFFMHPGF